VPSARRATLRLWAITFAGSWAAGLLLAITWALLIEPTIAESKTVDLVIPSGTAAAVALGQPPAFIPANLSLGPNGKLHVQNNDVVEHVVAGKAIPAGSVATVSTNKNTKEITCTIHPSGVLGVALEASPGPLEVLVISLIIGVPVALVLGAIITVARRLEG